MRKIDSRVKAGTRVRLHGNATWYTVESVCETRKWLKVVELAGSFQNGHIDAFSNKGLNDQESIIGREFTITSFDEDVAEVFRVEKAELIEPCEFGWMIELTVSHSRFGSMTIAEHIDLDTIDEDCNCSITDEARNLDEGNGSDVENYIDQPQYEEAIKLMNEYIEIAGVTETIINQIKQENPDWSSGRHLKLCQRLGLETKNEDERYRELEMGM
jgi:hypothetical protein